MKTKHSKGFGYATREMPQNHENIWPRTADLYNQSRQLKSNEADKKVESIQRNDKKDSLAG